MSVQQRYAHRPPTAGEAVVELAVGAVKGIVVVWMAWFALVAVIGGGTTIYERFTGPADDDCVYNVLDDSWTTWTDGGDLVPCVPISGS